jgi:prepilin-type N-terminal cleavage/methylation domain-containing protein
MNHPLSTRNLSNRLSQHNRGFTLIELLIVIAIVSLLAAIGIGVGAGMINSGKKTATVGVIQALDQTLDAYIDVKGDLPPALVAVRHNDLPTGLRAQVGNDNPGFYPAFDGTEGNGELLINSVGYYLYAVQDVAGVQEILAGINPKLIKQYTTSGFGQSEGGISVGSSASEQPLLLTVFDAWGNPIRFVHPKFDGIVEKNRRTQDTDGEPIRIDREQNGFFVNPPSGGREMIIFNVRRNKMTADERNEDPDLVADSDGGLCPSARPYFYSSGPDGDPSTTDDNIYTTIPTYIAPF